MTLEFCVLRDRCGLELAQVAAEFGESFDSVLRWESGDALPPDRVLRTLSMIADFSGNIPEVGCSAALFAAPEVLPRAEPATAKQRKSQFGQFMTPPSIAKFMASLFELPSKQTIRLLDAGAGRGALTSAVIERARDTSKIVATVVELDSQLLPDLRSKLAPLCHRTGDKCELIEGDFIEQATKRICFGNGSRFTHAILNPPYKKIGSHSKHRSLLRAAGLETVNLYTGFIGLALELLEPGGELVAIVPRSFCNGPYYQPFRRFVLHRAAIRHIHLFDARNKAFRDDGVLQENIILKLVRGGNQEEVTVSTSTDDSFSNYVTKQHNFDRIVFPDDARSFIHIPTGEDKQLLERPCFGHSLISLGLNVSTGPVVDFRLKEDLRTVPEAGTVPLLYPAHFDGTGLHWPKLNFKKSNAICDTIRTRKWLYPNGFYTIVRRFSSKEERRRIVANVIEPARLPGARIGIENHLNVFHAQRQPICEHLARGLAVYLNATAVDTYFRRFNGHTQVNATDLRAMRYPSRDALIVLGQWAKTLLSISQHEIDERVNGL